jgi:hypothetical protein
MEYCYDDYTWFYKSSKTFEFNNIKKITYSDDTIGINSSGDQLIHDSIIYNLEKFKVINKIESYNFGGSVGFKKVKTTYLIYKFAGDQPNLFYHERFSTIYFKYIGNNEDGTIMRFECIGFNGAEFRENLEKHIHNFV